MSYVLSQQDRSFATRPRARGVAADILRACDRGTADIDFSDVQASPSFLAELFVALTEADRDIVVKGANLFLANTAATVAQQVGVAARVHVEGLAIPA